jgi:uncharacterized protein (TIGR03118 family)
MKDGFKRGRIATLVAVLLAAVLTGSALAASTGRAAENSFVVHNLVSDQPGVADHTDPLLVNAWGLDALPTSPWWVADNHTDHATIYQADGTPASLQVRVPGGPTGLVANPGASFVVHEGANSGPARFLFSTEGGQILGWNPSVALDHAVVAADLSSVGTIYKGLAIASTDKGDRLYAADFHNARVDVFDGNFNLANQPGAFVDPKLPNGFAPFGIQRIGHKIFVAYAKQDPAREDEIAGDGLGFVDAYGLNGRFLGRAVSRGRLNAPWGLAHAPAGFGPFGGDLLVGNFGDGRIDAYAPQADGTYLFEGALRGTDGKPIAIDGLWALEFGKGAPANGPVDTLFFTAGPDDETHGLFGSIRASS